MQLGCQLPCQLGVYAIGIEQLIEILIVLYESSSNTKRLFVYGVMITVNEQ